MTTRLIDGEPVSMNEPMARALDAARKKLRKPRSRPFVVARITEAADGSLAAVEFDRRTTARAAGNQAAIQAALRGGRWGVWDERAQRWLGEISD